MFAPIIFPIHFSLQMLNLSFWAKLAVCLGLIKFLRALHALNFDRFTRKCASDKDDFTIMTTYPFAIRIKIRNLCD